MQYSETPKTSWRVEASLILLARALTTKGQKCKHFKNVYVCCS